jgi:bifunctional UDP-N-acetylglucosamine pyrophosphorylase / glucosamine-1-phosphate N-acetyltransferase
MRIMPFTAVILAAGLGTRMKSATPKVLHDLCGRPMVLWPVIAAQEAGAEHVIVVDSADRPTEAVLPQGVEIAVQPQRDGTGGAVKAAASQINGSGPVVVLAGDVPLVSADAIDDLIRHHTAGATMLTTILDDPTGYGRVVRNGNGSVERVVETKRPGDATPAELEIHEVNTGIFCFDAEALQRALTKLTANNAQGELYLPQVLELIDGPTTAHVADDPRLVLGVNDRVALAHVRELAQHEILETHMRNGVTFTDPRSATVDVTVTLGQDVTIEPRTSLKGDTHVDNAATVGPDTTLIDTTVGAKATVRVTWADRAAIGPGAIVGPFAYLRPGAKLGTKSKVGTFVEVKNSNIGDGSKVPHLSYIGDADIGEDSNIGAGTITANYDGFNKHRTTIGDRVKSSSDVTFVAPVSVGDDAWTAAGSVITNDIPDGALGVARSRQRNIDGYASRKRDADDTDQPGPEKTH